MSSRATIFSCFILDKRRGNSLKLRLDHSFHCEAPIRCDWCFIELNRCVSNQIIFSTTETVDFWGEIFRLIKRFVKNQTNRHEEKGFRFFQGEEPVVF